MFFIIILTSLSIIESAKILVVVPLPSISHQIVFRPLTQELINRGHEVTIITTDPRYKQGTSPNNNLTEIDVHNISYILWRQTFGELANKKISNLKKMTMATETFTKIFMEQLKDESVVKLITNKTIKFDLIIMNAFTPASLIYSHVFKAPVVLMSTYGPIPGDMEMIGSMIHPLLYPTHYQQKIYNLTIWEELNALYNYVAFTNMHKNDELDEDILLESVFGYDIPTLSNMKQNNVHALFINMHPILSHNQPVPPNVVYIWGAHKKPAKILPKELQSYLDSSKHGVIYVSFGSNFKTSQIPGDLLAIFVDVFSRLPYNILWKWDTDELIGKSENIKISKWLPQSDLLKHPNVKLFITQGGLQSTDEAINAGVPLIGIPHFSDQGYNTEKYLQFKIGTKIDYKTITRESLENAINTILTNYESYKKNIIELRTQLKDRPKSGLEYAVSWIEYLLRHGGVQHLRASGANMSCAEYYELELVLIILSGLIFLVLLLIVTMHHFILSLFRLRKIKVMKTSTS